MKFDVYVIGRWLNKRGALGLTSLLFVLACASIVGWTAVLSQEGVAHRANIETERHFTETIERDMQDYLQYGLSRGSLLTDLLRLHAAYAATGENDPAKLAKLANLQALLLANVTKANEWEIVAEARSQTRLVAEKWFASRSIVALTIFLSAILGIVCHLGLFVILRRIDNRLWWLPTTI